MFPEAEEIITRIKERYSPADLMQALEEAGVITIDEVVNIFEEEILNNVEELDVL